MRTVKSNLRRVRRPLLALVVLVLVLVIGYAVRACSSDDRASHRSHDALATAVAPVGAARRTI